MKTLDYYIKNLEVLYEDNHVIVVNKPVDVLSQKDITGDFSLVEIVKGYLKIKYGKPGDVYLGLVHRLDRRVGGVMLLAKTSKAAKRISEEIRTRNGFEKRYLALVEGSTPKNGEINIKLEKLKNLKAELSPLGKEAVLEYLTLEKNDKFSLVEIKLLTGRYNQIRASFKSIGHPVVGDQKYGSRYDTSLKLVSYKLSFIHPVKNTKVEIEIKNPFLLNEL